MIIFTQKVLNSSNINPQFTLSLTAEQRSRSRQQVIINNHDTVRLQLPRGITLKEGDLLATEKKDFFAIVEAKKELVVKVTAKSSLDLLKGAYHLGNRHVPLEINEDCLRLSPDSVLVSMLINLDLEVIEEVAPFYPEIGAYHKDE